MKYSKVATSVAEALVVMLIIVSWTTWMYKIYIESLRLSESTANKIQAIWIAREWMEAMINIRDTNWLVFGSDIKNCWNTLNYNASCICFDSVCTDTSTDIENKNYIIYKNLNNDNRWYLTWATNWNYSNVDYRNWNRVWLDSNWFYTQSWWLITEDIKPIFTREIKIRYIDTDNPPGWGVIVNSNDEKMEVKSIVQWADNSSSVPHRIELTTILTNYENHD